jgi:hypothetical protein
MDYIRYNREERDLCAHLFRLLLDDQLGWGPLTAFMGVKSVTNPRLFCEAAILRDAYFARKPNIADLMSAVCDLIALQNTVTNYTPFNDLPPDIRDNRRLSVSQMHWLQAHVPKPRLLTFRPGCTHNRVCCFMRSLVGGRQRQPTPATPSTAKPLQEFSDRRTP